MSPVAPRKERNPRTLVLALAGVVVGIVLLLVVFVFAIPSLTESGSVKVKLGTDTFDAGLTTKRADAIRRDGPILFSDVASGQNDIFLQHLGDDDATGWLAFDARRTGTTRDCTLHWSSDAGQFVDPCDDTIGPADGEGLKQYQVVVTEAGTVVINLDPDNPIPSSSTSSSSTSSTLHVTGTTPNG
jgi:hypothetical protein